LILIFQKFWHVITIRVNLEYLSKGSEVLARDNNWRKLKIFIQRLQPGQKIDETFHPLSVRHV